MKKAYQSPCSRQLVLCPEGHLLSASNRLPIGGSTAPGENVDESDKSTPLHHYDSSLWSSLDEA